MIAGQDRHARSDVKVNGTWHRSGEQRTLRRDNDSTMKLPEKLRTSLINQITFIDPKTIRVNNEEDFRWKRGERMLSRKGEVPTRERKSRDSPRNEYLVKLCN